VDEHAELLRKLALTGARVRLQQVQEEIAMLQRAFPKLDSVAREEFAESAAPAPAGGRRRRALSAAGRARIVEAQRKRWAAVRAKRGGRSPMSPSARRAVSLRMKKYWAQRRKAAE
jgi:BMFP domain-containing protein YqiC